MVISVIDPVAECIYGKFTNSNDKFVEFCLYLRAACSVYDRLVVCIDGAEKHFEIPLTTVLRGIDGE